MQETVHFYDAVTIASSFLFLYRIFRCVLMHSCLLAIILARLLNPENGWFSYAFKCMYAQITEPLQVLKIVAP